MFNYAARIKIFPRRFVLSALWVRFFKRAFFHAQTKLAQELLRFPSSTFFSIYFLSFLLFFNWRFLIKKSIFLRRKMRKRVDLAFLSAFLQHFSGINKFLTSKKHTSGNSRKQRAKKNASSQARLASLNTQWILRWRLWWITR